MKDVAAFLRGLRASACRSDLRAPSGANDAWLFAASSHAVLIADLFTHTLIEANRAAVSLLGSSRSTLIGSSLFSAFADDSETALRQAVAGARLGAGSSTRIHVASRRKVRDLGLTLSVVHAGGDSYLLVQLTIAQIQTASTEVSSLVLDAIAQHSEGFVVTDLGLRVTYANRAFIDMARLNSPEELHGKSLAHWLEFSQADLLQLEAQTRRREAVSVWTTTLRSARFSSHKVEICAVAVPDGENACWGFRINAAAPEAPEAVASSS